MVRSVFSFANIHFYVPIQPIGSLVSLHFFYYIIFTHTHVLQLAEDYPLVCLTVMVIAMLLMS